MKRFISAVIVLLLLMPKTQAQDITTMWPYMYADFKQGTVYFDDQQTLTAPLNIHLLYSSLHYLDGETIKRSFSSDIVLVEIDNEKFYMKNDQLMRVVQSDKRGFIAELVLVDFDEQKNSGGGAYGASSNVQSTRTLSSLDAGGHSITNHMELKSNKDEGSLLSLKKQYFIVTENDVYPANKRAFTSKLSPKKQEDFKQFTRKNKINWKSPESLFLLLDFLND